VSRPLLTRAGKVYLTSVIVTGSVVIAESIYHLVREPIGVQWFILAALTVISGSASVKLPSSPASISISETFVITAVLLYGPAAGTVLTALDGLVISFWMSKRHDEAHRALFNVSAPALSAWCSAHLFFLLAGIPPLIQEPASVNAILPALIFFAFTYFGLNSWLVTFVIALERRVSPIRIWTSNFLLLSLNYFAGASVAILLVGFTRTIDLGYVGITLPLLLVLYFTFKTTMSRIEDANKHVAELNRLYLSTIETFAMAIDAKDQVTHGHIRRVQQHAMSLAKEIGVRDEHLLKAIEAAALLHDMGKLAVPEYILNKPGKLTETEFAKMKLHAGVGADILSAVDFPYPVVPIVRHHHENWDGSGYPAGLKGTAIPIGARILSVVDCFDALTSDRPYRPRLADDEAMKIVVDRRGTMYDPLVVDTFVAIQRGITPPHLTDNPESRHALNEIASQRMIYPHAQSEPGFQQIAASSDEMLTLFDLARALAGKTNLGDLGDAVINHLRRLVPASLYVFYAYDKTADHLEIRHAVGDGPPLVGGLRIQLGQRLSGWVAANRQTICNSDPVLDFGDSARVSGHRLRSCLSTALLDGDELVGVLSIYAIELNAFTDGHRRIIEVVAQQIAPAFKQVTAGDRSGRREPAFGLQTMKQLEQAARHRHAQEAGRSALPLVLVQVHDIGEIADQHGSEVHDSVVKHIVRDIRLELRDSDLLCRLDRNEFVVLLASEDSDAAASVAARIQSRISERPISLANGLTITVCASVTSACTPTDGVSLDELFAVARERGKLTRAPDGSHIH
jgi:diguanylate cyclase (GGDEF)-like protein/putative nucleotidyltransferase with HDIG domain